MAARLVLMLTLLKLSLSSPDPRVNVEVSIDVDDVADAPGPDNGQQTTIACADEELTIDCKPGNWINLISANYGRLSNKICNPSGYTWPTNCKSSTTMNKLAVRCSGRSSCNMVVSNAIFWDPCMNVPKYIEVHYTCEPLPPTPTCPDKFVEINGCCYFFSVNNGGLKATWSDAARACQVLGNETNLTIELAEVGAEVRQGDDGCSCDDVALMSVITSKGDLDHWMGAKDIDDNNNWVWQRTGKVFPISNPQWYHNDPKAGNGKKCLNAGVWTSIKNRPYFRDFDCTLNHYYICQAF